MTSMEFEEWKAYEKMEPGEPFRGDVQAALIAHVMANIHRKKTATPLKISDFLIEWNKKQKQRPDLSQLKSKFRSWLAIHNKHLKSKK